MGKESKQLYTPQRVAMVAEAIAKLADQVASQAESMQKTEAQAIAVGDAMLRRSYRHISQFAKAIEREINRSQKREDWCPWDELDDRLCQK